MGRSRAPVGFKLVEKFRRNEWYAVMRDYDWTPIIPFFRLETLFYYRLKAGQRLKFQGNNFAPDCPEFLAEDGRKVIFRTKAKAFWVVGRLAEA